MNCWTKYLIAGVSSVLACVAGGSLAVACDVPSQLRSAKPRIIQLKGIGEAFGFYLRGQQDQLMLFKSEDVVEAIQARIADLSAEGLKPAAKNSAGFLAEVQRDLPLKEPTDLFKYALIGGYGHEVEDVAAKLLTGGRAYVNSWSSFQRKLPTLTSIKVFSSATQDGTLVAQAFCTLNNANLLTIIYMVE